MKIKNSGVKYKKSIIFGWLFSYLITYGLIISESGTCTQGSYDEYFFGTIIIIISLSVLTIIVIFTKEYWRIPLFLLLPHIITILLFIKIIPPYIINTTIKGISICQGNSDWGGFDNSYGFEQLPKAENLFEYLFAPILLCAGLILIINIVLTIYLSVRKRD